MFPRLLGGMVTWILILDLAYLVLFIGLGYLAWVIWPGLPEPEFYWPNTTVAMNMSDLGILGKDLICKPKGDKGVTTRITHQKMSAGSDANILFVTNFVTYWRRVYSSATVELP